MKLETIIYAITGVVSFYLLARIVFFEGFRDTTERVRPTGNTSTEKAVPASAETPIIHPEPED